MKDNNRCRIIGLSGLLMSALLSGGALAEENIGTSAEELGISDYRHFVIYPRLEKALTAQRKNDEKQPCVNLSIFIVSFPTTFR